MNRQDLLGKINTYLGRFTQEVKQLNAANQYDINIHSENVLIPLLKEVFGYQGLQNANVQLKNAPAIDLIDYESGVSIQVTATADADKISHTLNKFKENELNKPFDRLIIYIITEKQASYRKDFKSLLPDNYDFQPERDIIDNISLFKYISEQVLNTQKLNKIAHLLTDEFSELKIEARKATNDYISRTDGKSDRIYPNLLEMTVPNQLYIADLQFDFAHYREELKADLKARKRFGKLRHLSDKDDVKFFFQQSNCSYFDDYVLYDKKVLTFRNLHHSTESLRRVIDLGTITVVTPDEFIGTNLDRENVFKKVLNTSLTQDLRSRQIEWVYDEKVFRFRMTSRPPRPLKVQWKSKVGRSVVSGVKSKGNETKVTDEDGTQRTRKGKHYTSFRHLAFGVTFNKFGEKWYLAIKPDWSFTSPADGYKTSSLSAVYSTGLKKLEKNKAVLESFQFLAGYLIHLSKGDLWSAGFTLKFSEFANYFEMQPAVPDDVWVKSEPKGKDDKLQLDIEFEE
ncbi:SMEK domain-containing protein [Fibrella sp. WM1]|uniref:SMEK domain-containing protein n=1 Tax=Fibrella musci TaxID=3242485 RepID=UPI003521F614